MIKFEHVEKAYDGKPVLTDFNLEIPAGEFLTVVGTSGAGKTTIMRMVNGLLLPDRGRVLVNGKNVSETDLVALRRNIGYSIQGNALFPHLTAGENIAFVLDLLGESREVKDQVIKEKLALVGLPLELKDKYPDQLSGGQAQRVGIARSLAADPEILLMDEPFGAVDAITRNQLQYELKKLQQEMQKTIMFITHDISEALKLGSRVLVINAGKIEQLATPQEILAHPASSFVEQLLKFSNVSLN